MYSLVYQAFYIFLVFIVEQKSIETVVSYFLFSFLQWMTPRVE